MTVRPTVIDLATVRRARVSKYCGHAHAEVDSNARVLQCSDCGAQLDPFEHLGRLANEAEWISSLRDERRRLNDEIAAMRAQLTNLRARIRTAAKRDPIVARLQQLRASLRGRLTRHPDEDVQRMRSAVINDVERMLAEAIGAVAKDGEP